MAILPGTADLLLHEARRRPFAGRVLELARMTVFLDDERLARLARRAGTSLADVSARRSRDPVLGAHGFLDDESFFRRLGFTGVDSLDVSDYEGAGIVHDLNEPVPEELHGRYDVVFDGGTLQHVFHQPRLMANLHALTAPSGRVIHGLVPCHNFVDHGFYTFSPTFFQDFYARNGWQIETFYLVDFLPVWLRGRLYAEPMIAHRYEPGMLDDLSYGRFGARQTGIFLVATKAEGATGDQVPQQGHYKQVWAGGAGRGPAPKESTEIPALRPWDPLLLHVKRWKERLRRHVPRRLPGERVGRFG